MKIDKQTTQEHERGNNRGEENLRSEQKVSRALFWTSPDLTCSQHVSSLLNHHPSGRWRSKSPGRNPGSRINRPHQEESSVSGIIRRSPAVDITRPRLNAVVPFTAELSIKHKRSRNAIVPVLIRCVLTPYCQRPDRILDICHHRTLKAKSTPRIPAGAAWPAHNCTFTVPYNICSQISQTMRKRHLSLRLCFWRHVEYVKHVGLNYTLRFFFVILRVVRFAASRNVVVQRADCSSVCSVQQTC